MTSHGELAKPMHGRVMSPPAIPVAAVPVI